MNKKRILMVVVLAISVIGLHFFFSGGFREKPVTPAQEYVTNYLIDKNQQIRFEETSISREIQSFVKVSPKGDITADDHPKEDIVSEVNSKKENATADDNPEKDTLSDDNPEEDAAGDPVNHNMAEYFRYLQTDIGEGTSPSERTESIEQHLLDTLPMDKAEEIFELYEKFNRFERDAVEKSGEWRMPENADETLELIGKMRNYQQEYFGKEAADTLFGAEMKVMEYNARRAGVINDSNTPGLQKEELLEQLAVDMWGEEAYQIMNENKDPYDILDEKLLVYGHDLAAMDTATRAEEIKKFREMYLPPGY